MLFSKEVLEQVIVKNGNYLGVHRFSQINTD